MKRLIAAGAVGVVLLLWSSGFRAAPGAAAFQLKYVAIVSRHGVRAPTWTAERLNRYSSAAWPDFGVPAGDLTPPGRLLITLMGSYYGEWLTSEGLVSRDRCSDAARVFIWADTDQRTLETGRAFGESLLPGCSIAVHSQTSGGNDPLFDPIASGAVTPDLEVAARRIRERVGGDTAAYLDSKRAAFLLLHHILTGGMTTPEHPFESPAGLDLVVNGTSLELSGPLSAASTLSEVLLLEYANGFTGNNLGWGRLTDEGLSQVLELHTAYADLMRRTPDLARARGSNLLFHVLRSIEQAATGNAMDGALGKPGDAVLFVSGHDTNLSNISGMLDLSWTLPGYPADDTPPGGAIVFALWRNVADGRYSVSTRYVAQTPGQMHRAEALTLTRPPAMQDLTLPGCRAESTEGKCPWTAFDRSVRAGIDPAFVP